MKTQTIEQVEENCRSLQWQISREEERSKQLVKALWVLCNRLGTPQEIDFASDLPAGWGLHEAGTIDGKFRIAALRGNKSTP